MKFGSNLMVTDQPPRLKRDLFPVISALSLLAFAALFIVVASSVFRNQSNRVSLQASRSLTTEWSLLQELKAQTDRQLLAKEREIETLNGSYLRLLHSNASPKQLQILESQLRKAESERDAILANRIDIPSAAASTAPAAVAQPVASQTSADNSPVIVLLEQTVSQLHAEVAAKDRSIGEMQRELAARAEEAKLKQESSDSALSVERAKVSVLESRISVLEKRLAELTSGYRDLQQGSEDALAAEKRKVGELSALIDAAKHDARVGAEQFLARAGELRNQSTIPIGDLETLSLVRAIVSDPRVRAVYPQLLGSFDRYLAEYGAQERLAGTAEAYAAAGKLLGAAAKNTPGAGAIKP
ncbi:MAG TPA: hypothetical protein VMW73_06285 [Spirochaetia bacterium]|nr:hypothetical protein [Spirochaetia bacterium]